MAKKTHHANWGMALSAIADTVVQLGNIRAGRQEKFSFWELGGALLLGYAGGTLADTLEPSGVYGPNHRSTLHSLGLAAIMATTAAHPKNRGTIQGRLMQAFAWAHFSHLALDIKTPKGLPWINPKFDRAMGLKSLSFHRMQP